MNNLYFLMIFILLFPIQICPQWVQTNGPYGGNIKCFAVSHDSTGKTSIYAGTDNGVFLSTDSGNSWNSLSSGLSDYPINALAVSGKNIIAGTNWSGVYFSADYGLSWSKSSSEIIQQSAISTFAVSGNSIFAAAFNDIFLSTDNGVTWQATAWQAAHFPANHMAYSLTIMGTSIFVGTEEGVYFSDDNGSHWKSKNSGLPEFSPVFALTASGTNIFAGTPNGVYLLSSNAGSWKKVSSGLQADTVWGTPVRAIASDGKNIYAAVTSYVKVIKSGIYVSADNGTSWKKISSGLPEYLLINCLAVTGTNIFAGTAGGIFRSTDNGASWSASNSGLLNTDISALAVKGKELYAFAELQGVHLSTDNGESWMPVNSGLPENPRLGTLVENGGKIFAGGAVHRGWESYSALLSVYDGSVWKDLSAGLPEDAIVTSLFIRDSNIFAGTWYFGIFLSANNGAGWDTLNSGLPENFCASALAAYGDSIFAGGSSTMDGGVGRIFYTTNSGKYWKDVGPGFSGSSVYALAAEGPNILAGTEDGIYLSTNSGKNWAALNSGLPPHKAAHYLVLSGKNILAESEGSIYVSTNNGVTWSNFGSGLPPNAYCSIAVSSTYIFAGTWGKGVWRRPITELMEVIDQTKSVFLAVFSLEQNYPNPFNPSTKIKYSIPDEGKVTLSVYNVLGEEVRVIVDEMLKAGIHEVTINSGGLPSGVYFYTLTARSASGNRNFRSSKKFILLK